MTTKVKSRQGGLNVFMPLAIANIGAANGYSFYVPPGSYLTTIEAFVATAFDSATTNVLTVTDGTTVLINAQSLKATGAVTVAVPKKYYPAGGTITVTVTETGATATVGAAYVNAKYIGANRESEFQDG